MVNFFARYCSLYKIWDTDSIDKWKRQKQAGIVKFILVEGVIKWGIFSALIFLSITLTGKEFGSKEVVTTCLIWLVASIVYGYSHWYGTSLAYTKQLKVRQQIN
ncbi:hypothetical protein Q4489_13805 [Thalassotalea sp. 1_MG-2023]|uniref:hypothetical protein n=1 Tax=Thalassotalea sp. 1_MG-2023 TaxID=3062680 RepID=UPI0026E42D32|nr:hypothetical protein [Thalassotalea sp. 1_MG-2023]MDO6428090.1 hypothetical protein [Thalassotalea sp. 1_MG-2023]